MSGDPLALARQALERGDYGEVLRQLEPLQIQHPPRTALGAGVRLLMATALMGQGQIERAADCCRSLLNCQDPGLRERARDLLEVLEAPALRRPREWSLSLPDLGQTVLPEGLGEIRRRRLTPSPPPPPSPPVGPTRTPLGFALVVALVLLVVAGLLGGCMEVRTDLRFEGPGRLQIRHELRAAGGTTTPWEKRFATRLVAEGFRGRPEGGVGTVLSTPVLPAGQALDALAASLAAAADLSGLSLPAPRLHLDERNWLVGVRQRLSLDLDLSGLPPQAGLDLALRLIPMDEGSIRRAEPLAVRTLRPAGESRSAAGVLWPLEPGRRNLLDLECWRWSPLGLGGVAIAIGLGLVLLLQRLRLVMGFGLPQLPA